jgi:rubrerythrin
MRAEKTRNDSAQSESQTEALSPDKRREICAAYLDLHVESESAILEDYRKLAGPIESGPARFLLDLILHDEERHHGLLRMMAKYMRIKNRHKSGLPWVIEPDELTRDVRKLQEHERETIAACRELKNETPPEESEFFSALLDALILDSEKHERLLLAIEHIVQKSS